MSARAHGIYRDKEIKTFEVLCVELKNKSRERLFMRKSASFFFFFFLQTNLFGENKRTGRKRITAGINARDPDYTPQIFDYR